MKTIFSISSDAFSLLKLKQLDEEFSTGKSIEFQVVFLGEPAQMEELLTIMPRFHHEPIVIDMSLSTTAQETARAFLECETLFALHEIDLLLVPDASNAALASALVAIKKPIPVLSLDAGLRSNDRRKNSEINRKAIDSISELYFTSEAVATQNLISEGIDEKVIFEVGSLLEQVMANTQLDLTEEYLLCYFSHPSNENDPIFYSELIPILNDLSEKKDIVFPIEENTVRALNQRNILQNLNKNIRIVAYATALELLNLIKKVELILTDDEQAQVLSSALGKQCITFGTMIEHSFTVEMSTNHVVGTHLHELRNLSLAILEGYQKKKKKTVPTETSKKIKEILLRI